MEISPTFLKSPLYVFVATVVALWGLHVASDFFIPVFLAAILAFLIAPVTRGLRKLKLPEWACVVVSALLVVLPMAGLVYLLISQIQSLVQNWPKLSASLLHLLEEVRRSGFANRLHIVGVLDPNLLKSNIQSHFGSELMMTLTSLKRIVSAGSFLVLTLFFSVAMVASRRHLKRSFDHLLSSYTTIGTGNTVSSMAHMMESFLVARTSISVGLGIADFLILLSFGVPYSLLLGVFLGLTTWIPVLGFFMGIAPVVVVGFASGKSLGSMLAIWGAIGAIWVLQDHVITPKWVGHRLKLNFLATYLAFFAGGLLWGAWGMILSVPLLGLIRIACDASPKLRPWAFVLGEDDLVQAESEIPIKHSKAIEQRKTG